MLIKIFLCVVGLGYFGLNHDGGVASLVELGLVRDSAHDVARVQADGCSQGGERCDEYRNDDFEDLLFGHNV